MHESLHKFLNDANSHEELFGIIKNHSNEFANYIINKNPEGLMGITNQKFLSDILRALKSTGGSYAKILLGCRNEKMENMFHCLAKKNCYELANELLISLQPSIVTNLLMDRNEDGEHSLMIFVAQNSPNVMTIWNIFEKSLAGLENASIQQLFASDNEGKNILHYCGEIGNYQLFSAICSSSIVMKEDVLKALDKRDSAIKTIRDDQCLKKLLEQCQFPIQKFSTTFQQDVLWHLCKHDLIGTYEAILKKFDNGRILEMVTRLDEDKNNAFMIGKK